MVSKSRTTNKALKLRSSRKRMVQSTSQTWDKPPQARRPSADPEEKTQTAKPQPYRTRRQQDRYWTTGPRTQSDQPTSNATRSERLCKTSSTPSNSSRRKCESPNNWPIWTTRTERLFSAFVSRYQTLEWKMTAEFLQSELSCTNRACRQAERESEYENYAQNDRKNTKSPELEAYSVSAGYASQVQRG
jgi:hypothetical protein